MRPVKNTLPVNLLIEGCPAAVIGGGRVGLRKVGQLLDAGAAVRLICPDCVPELEALAAEGRIEWAQRRFETTDPVGAAVVFACTDDKHVNRAILEASRAAGVLCCCADGHWAAGDFTTPAVIRSSDLVIAISTNGRSCRQAKLVKESLAKHLSAISSGDLFVAGTSHEELALRERSALHCLEEDRRALGLMLAEVWGVHEFLILNTCNRIETVAVVSKEARASGVVPRLMGLDRLPAGGWYQKSGFDAFSHLALVLAGMKSQVPGEAHIVGQMRLAQDEALTAGWMRGALSAWCDAALKTARELRPALEPLVAVKEIEHVCFDWLEAERWAEPGSTVAVAGTGILGAAVLRGLLRRGIRCLSLYRTRMPKLSEKEIAQITFVPLAQWEEVFAQADTVISAIDVAQPFFTWSQRMTRETPCRLVDLGAPRNIDPAFDDQPNYTVADLDTLKNRHRRLNGMFDRAAACAAALLENHRPEYEAIAGTLRDERTES